MASLWALGGLSRREIVRRLWHRINIDDVIARSAQLSYFFLFSLFPFLFFLASLFGYLAEPGRELRTNLLSYLQTVVPYTVYELITSTLDEITENRSGGKLSLGLLMTFWTASFGVGAVISTLNAAYGVKETRPLWKVQGISFGLTVSLQLLIVSALILLVQGETIGLVLAEKLGLGVFFSFLWRILQWPIVLSFVLFAFALIYYFAPNVKEIRWQWITPGSVLGLTLWLLVSFTFRTYISYFNTYSVTYGSLGVVMILLLWLYLTGAAIMVGGQLNAVIEHAAAQAGVNDAKLPGETRPGERDESSETEEELKQNKLV